MLEIYTQNVGGLDNSFYQSIILIIIKINVLKYTVIVKFVQ